MTLVYDLGHPHDGEPSDVVALVGGKAANLGVMAGQLSLPVPPGFVISTAACLDYLADGWPAGLEDEIRTHMAQIERRVDAASAIQADPAPGERPLRGPGVDAGDDGHGS